MDRSPHGTVSRTNRKVPARAWRLSLLATLIGGAAAGLAAMFEGTPRAIFAGAAIVFLIAAFFCVGVTSLESQGGPPFDPDAPPAEPPVPQSQVTLVYDPSKAPNDSIERHAQKPPGSG